MHRLGKHIQGDKKASERVGVSVIIPVYNMAHYLETAVLSVLEGGFEDAEVIIVDDGSTDGTAAVAAQFVNPDSPKFDARVCYKRQPNKGKSVAVNWGLNLMKGDYVTILDADDRLTVASLAARYDARIRSDGTPNDLIIGSFEVFDGDGRAGFPRRPETESAVLLRRQFYSSYRTPFHLNACLISSSLIERTGLLDESLFRCQDIDYSLRLLEKASGIVCLDQVVYLYRKHRNSVLKRVRYRLKTIKHRPMVFWKNFNGLTRYWATACCVVLDMAKGVYELMGNYKR